MAENTEHLPSWAEIADLVGRLDAGEYTDVDLTMPGLRLRMSTTPNAFASAPAGSTASEASAPEARRPEPQPERATSRPPVPAAADAASQRLVEVTAPVLGAFYGKPSPDADAFVDIGSMVAADTTVGIVEVMKLKNPVTAGVAGRVAEVVAKDGDLVEFGQVLFRIEPGTAP